MPLDWSRVDWSQFTAAPPPSRLKAFGEGAREGLGNLIDFATRPREPLTRLKKLISGAPDLPEAFAPKAIQRAGRGLLNFLLPESVMDAALLLPTGKAVGALKSITPGRAVKKELPGIQALIKRFETPAPRPFPRVPSPEEVITRRAAGRVSGGVGPSPVSSTFGPGASPAAAKEVLESVSALPPHVLPSASKAGELRRLVGSEAAGRLQPLSKEVIKDVTGPSRIPFKKEMAELDARARFLSERGGANIGLLTRLGGGATGAVVGGTQGETTSEHVRNALVGAMLGLGAVEVPGKFAAARQAGKGVLRAAGGAPFEALADVTRASLLAGLAPVKATLGGTGAVVAQLVDTLAKNPRQATQLLKTIPGSLKGAGKEAIGQLTGRLTPPGLAAGREFTTTGPLAIPGRIMGAVDVPARKILQGFGLSESQIADALLFGKPSTRGGRGLLQAATSPFGRQVVPIGARTSIGLFEQGAKRFATPAGIAALGAGAALPEDVRKSFTGQGLAIAAGGPVGLPLALGAAGRTAFEEGGLDLAGFADAIAAAAARESIIPRSLKPSQALRSRVQPIVGRERFPEQIEEIRELFRGEPSLPVPTATPPSLDWEKVDWSQFR